MLRSISVRAVLSAGVLVVPLVLIPGLPAGATAGRHAVRACARPIRPGVMACDAYVLAGANDRPLVTGTPSGYGPADLLAAYALTAAAAKKGGKTVAIVDAQDDPNAESDLAVYRSEFGLPACTTADGCFTKVNQTGGTTPPTADPGWAEEISLDLDMVSAICPKCHVLLVEANSPSNADLGTAENTAAQHSGVVSISNSYGGSESSSDPATTAAYYNHPKIAITASAGDDGYGVEYPAAAAGVTAVGGTSLSVASGTSRGWTESVWGSASDDEGGTGSGCSTVETKPAWQKDTGCTKRTVVDVSAVADPNTGVAVYDTYDGEGGWVVLGGTSVAAPIIAGVYALGAKLGTGKWTSNLYKHTASFNDVTSGTNGSCGGTYLCTAVTGYDGPTGLGTPKGVGAF